MAWRDCGVVNEGSLGGSDMGGLPLSGNLINGGRPRLDMIHCSNYTFTSDQGYVDANLESLVAIKLTGI